MPVVSIVVPTYNREKSISTTIDSVLSQTFSDWELIIVDDHSTDNTKIVVDEYIKRDKRIKYVVNYRSKGVSGARNTGIDESTGEYVSFCDSDDTWVETHLEQSISVLTKENIDVSFSYYYFDIEGELVKCSAASNNEELSLKVANDLNAKCTDDFFIFGRNFFEYTLRTYFYCYNINTSVINKKALLQVGYFNESLTYGEDDDLVIRIIQVFDFCLIRKFGYYYSIGNEDSLYGFTDRIKLTEKIQYTDYETSILPKDHISKFTKKGRTDLKLVKLKLGYVKKSSIEFNKKRCTDCIRKGAAKRYFSIGYINRVSKKRTALYFYIQSIRYGFFQLPIFFIIKLIFPRAFKSIKKVPISLW